MITLSKELTLMRDQLNERGEEIDELKAERNNTRVTASSQQRSQTIMLTLKLSI